jgi:hypothetical protein
VVGKARLGDAVDPGAYETCIGHFARWLGFESAKPSRASAPSLEVLTQVRNISYAPGDVLKGSLNAAALADIGFDVDGFARFTAVIANGESLLAVRRHGQSASSTSGLTDGGTKFEPPTP